MKKGIVITLILFFVTPYFIHADAIEQDRKVESFTEVDMRISGNVYVTQGSSHKVVVKGRESDLEDLVTEVNGGTLVIRYENWFNRHEKVDIYIEMVDIEEFDVSGSGLISAESAIKSEELELEVSGSGSIIIDELSVKDLENEISGSGKVMLKGSSITENFEFEISGSGKIQAFDLKAEQVSGEISGSGKVEITAIKRLEAEISGSGKIYYKGNPVIDAEISGSGKVLSAD